MLSLLPFLQINLQSSSTADREKEREREVKSSQQGQDLGDHAVSLQKIKIKLNKLDVRSDLKCLMLGDKMPPKEKNEYTI